jgi:hypothetical protein
MAVLKNIRKIAGTLRNLNFQAASGEITESYVGTEPGAQAALDTFRGEWSSRFPPPFSELNAGKSELFEDARVQWALAQFGDVQGKSVLELGPLEGGHSYMLEKAGFASVLGIEANTRAYLKCLITKEITDLSHTRFVLGDFVKFLRASPPKFDAAFVCGVLYHMENPAELIELISHAADQVFIWTHHYVPSWQHVGRFTAAQPSEHKGFQHSLYRQEYGASLKRAGFCGGPLRYSSWMTREDILSCLKYFGFVDMQTNFDDPNHPNGPAFALVAKKSAAGSPH